MTYDPTTFITAGVIIALMILCISLISKPLK